MTKTSCSLPLHRYLRCCSLCQQSCATSSTRGRGTLLLYTDNASGKMISVSQNSWPLISNQLKFVNRQLYHQTAGLEFEYNKISFMVHCNLPAECDRRKYSGVSPESFSHFSPNLGSPVRRAGRKFIKTIKNMDPKKLHLLTEVAMEAINRLCIAHPKCSVTYTSRWYTASKQFKRLPQRFCVGMLLW
jgi:hypothetical protein